MYIVSNEFHTTSMIPLYSRFPSDERMDDLVRGDTRTDTRAFEREA